MENENELQNDSTFEEVVVSGSSTNIEILNNNICNSSMFLSGTLGIIAGIILGRVFDGIFRS